VDESFWLERNEVFAGQQIRRNDLFDPQAPAFSTGLSFLTNEAD